jgi:hypothetical protein
MACSFGLIVRERELWHERTDLGCIRLSRESAFVRIMRILFSSTA